MHVVHGYEKGRGAFLPAILGRSRIQPAPGLLSWLAHSLTGVAVGCDGPSPSGSALAERQSLTGHSRLAVAFLRSCWAVMEVDLIVPASSSPDKTRRSGRVVLNSSLLSRCTSVAIPWPNKINKISEAHALGYMHKRGKAAPLPRARLWPAPSYPRVRAHPLAAKRLLVRDPRLGGTRGLFGPRRQAEKTRGASLLGELGCADRTS